MKIIDAHTHIDYLTYKHQPGVVGCVCSATTESDWNNLVKMVDNKYLYGAFGVHPWFIDSVKKGFDIRLKEILNSNSNYMVGEIGLDKYKPDMENQIDVFVKQFDLAIQFKRPVFLHCVGAWDKILNILKRYKKLPIIVLHDFNGNEKILNDLLRYENIYFSFGKNVLYGENHRIEQIESNRILVETDGKSDVSLIDVVNTISNIKNESYLSKIIYENTQRVLKNGQTA